jgi:hypothetical protein
MSNPVFAESGTLVANTQAEVDLAFPYPFVTVVNRDGADEIWFTVDGTDVTVGGPNAYCVPKLAGAVRKVAAVTSWGPTSASGKTGAVIKLKSAGIPKFNVEGTDS